MKLHPRLSRDAVALVSRFETFHPAARPAAGGGWTIGYGHTRTAREGAQISRADAEALLMYDLSLAADAVEAALFAPAAQRQFDAFTAFCFNIGADNFRASSALARFNAGAELEAADEIERWRNAELGAGAQVVDALVRRRAAEKAHFLGLPEGFSKSPSAVLRPLAFSELSPADAPASSTSSATLTAANGIQARLRELVPEPVPQEDAAPEAEASGPAEVEPEAPPFPDPPSAPELSLEAAPRPVIIEAPAVGEAAPPAPYVVAPPPPPPSEVEPFPANDLAPPPEPEEEAPPPAPPLVIGAVGAEAAPGARRARFRLTSRAMYAILTALGACLVVAAAVLILGGRPTVSNLLLGVVGALMLTPGVYGLSGPGRRGD